ncbi:CHAP domain-containing protein [Roseococcus sp. DSY-14]|uniref:CHAP domain-containing protein n=1 Tax=Roseococcus sp. DSY-14 TaxID=3369650 RepID=UPI00387B8322
MPAPQAQAARSDSRQDARSASVRSNAAMRPGLRPAVQRSFAGGISCVPYARSITGMAISGNGRDWWHNAAGRYARGQRPETGSILSFPGSGGMASGHVAVVSRIVHARMIEIDHANWGGPGIRRGTVMRGINVIDVSDDNSWTRVRVQVGWDGSTYGREYPTHGFIHNRPATAYAAVEDMVRPVSYTTRRDAARPQQARNTRPATAARQAQPARRMQVAQASARR